MKGALSLQTPTDLLSKLGREVALASGDPSNPDHALNAVSSAYHLREWIWHDILQGSQSSRIAVMGKDGAEADWNAYVNGQFPRFHLLREICNGSKHLEAEPTDRIKGAFEGRWDKQGWDEGPWDAVGHYVILKHGSSVSVLDLITEAKRMWESIFTRQRW